MKTKYSVIPFIPAVIAAIGLKIMSMFAVDGNGLLFGMNKSGINYFIIEIILGLFAVCVLINLFDRKTAPVYPVKKNFVSGVFAVISGIAIVGSSFLALINATPDNTDNYLLSIIAALFSIPAAIAMIMIGKVHFSGKSIVSNVSMFFVFPALWGCSELVSEFLAATKVSISASDMTPLFCYIFITLYLFSSSMVVSRVKGRNPVKACFIYGMPAAAVSLSYGVGAVLTSSVENTGISALVNGVMFIVLGIYIVSFSVEMFAGCLTKAEVEIIESLPEDDDTYENSYISSGGYDELVASDRKEDDVPASDDSYEAVAQGLSDFVMGYDEEKYDDATIKNENINDGLVLGYDNENQTQPAEKIATEPLKEETAKPVAEAPAEPEIPEDDDTYENSYISSGGYDELVASDRKEDDVPASDDSYEAVAQGLSDFVMGYDEEKYDDATIKNENINDGLVLGYDNENQTQPAEKIATEPLKEETAKPVAEAPAEPEIPEEPVYAKRLDVSEEKTEPVKAEAPVKAPVEDTEVSDDRMSEIDRLLKELEDKK